MTIIYEEFGKVTTIQIITYVTKVIIAVLLGFWTTIISYTEIRNGNKKSKQRFPIKVKKRN